MNTQQLFDEQFNKIERWVKKSNEDYEEIEWDGELCKIFCNDDMTGELYVSEVYTLVDLQENGII